MRLQGRAALVSGAESPLGAAVARALAAAGAEIVPPGEAPLDLLVEASALPALGPALAEEGEAAPGSPPEAAPQAALDSAPEPGLEALRPLLALPRLALRLRPGGALLLVTAAPAPASGWIGPHLALRAALVAELARELAPRRVRANGLVGGGPAGGARLPGFLARGKGDGEAVEAALWLLGAATVTGQTLTLAGP